VLIQTGASPIERLRYFQPQVGSCEFMNLPLRVLCDFFAVFAVLTFLDAECAKKRKERKVDVRKPNSIQNVQECDATEGEEN